MRLFSAVPSQDSSVFRNARIPELEVETSTWDRTPYRLAPVFEGTVFVQAGSRISLAGDEAGAGPWSVDNFLLFEVGAEPHRFVIGAAEPVRYGGSPLEYIARGYSFGAGEIDLTPYFPPGEVTQFRILALDYGGTGYLSDVFLVVRGSVREPEAVRLAFVREQADSFVPLNVLGYGEPFLIEVRFDAAPEEASQDVTLEWDDGASKVTVFRAEDDAKMFRSELITLRPPSVAEVEP